jgi:hypothetical protein
LHGEQARNSAAITRVAESCAEDTKHNHRVARMYGYDYRI